MRPQQFLVTTDPGIEDVVTGEVAERCPGASATTAQEIARGLVRIDGSRVADLRRLRTVHHVVDLRAEGEAGTLEDVKRIVGAASFEELHDAGSFRVSSTCAGDAALERIELQRAAGAVLHRRFGTPVDLEGFEVNVRVDLYGQRLAAGIQVTREPLSNRIRRGRALRSSLKPTLAAAMIRLAGAHRGPGALVDPMCGAAVIPVEAAAINPDLRIAASDWDEATVETACGTLRNHGLAIEATPRDARALGAEMPGRWDYVVTDPPYGLRQAKRARLTDLYTGLLVSFERALRDRGRLAVIVVKHRVFAAALERTGLRVAHERTVAAGTLEPRIFVLEK